MRGGESVRVCEGYFIRFSRFPSPSVLLFLFVLRPAGEFHNQKVNVVFLDIQVSYDPLP